MYNSNYVGGGTAGGSGQTAYQNYTGGTVLGSPSQIVYGYSFKQPVEITKYGFTIRHLDDITIKDHQGQMLFQIDKDGLYKCRYILEHDTDERGMLFIFNEDVL
jgi:hypothetical protein